jgi:hypothetical protein
LPQQRWRSSFDRLTGDLWGLNISSFGQDDAGELYVTDWAGGHVYKIIGTTKP